MSERIPQSVSKLVVFRAYLASDGATPATGKTIAITISKNGATSFSNPAAGATNATEMASGFYKFTLGTGDIDTQGPLAWRGAEGTIHDAGDVYSVVSAKNAGFTGIPDVAAEAPGGLYTRGTGAGQINQAANGQIDVNEVAISGDSTAADNAESFFDGTGYGDVLQRTTIATLASQTSFTLTAGSADNDAYNDCTIVIQDASTAAQKAIGIVKDYTGSTKTVTLLADPGVFTMATTDIVTILAPDFLTRYIAAICHGVVTGAGTETEVFKGIDGTTRATVAVDASGNRSSVTYG